MKLRILLTLSMIAGLLLVRCQCGNGPTAGTITDTDTGVAKIEGHITFRNGGAVKTAAVDLHDQALVKEMVLGKSLALAALIRSGSTHTDINGYFAFDSVDTGDYRVAVNYRDSLGGVFAAVVPPTRNDTTVTVNGTLGLLGGIEGMVDDSLFHRGDSVRVYIPELDLWAAVDSTGYFMDPALPAYTYHVIVYVNGVRMQTPADTTHVTVAEGDTTSIVNIGSGTGSVIIDGRIKETP